MINFSHELPSMLRSEERQECLKEDELSVMCTEAV